MELLGREVGPLFVRIRKGGQVTEDRLLDRQVARTTRRTMDRSTRPTRCGPPL